MKAVWQRFFINHPEHGTVEIKKTIPLHRKARKRKNMLELFCHNIGLYGCLPCKHCNMMLLNPQSRLLHMGGWCRSKNDPIKTELSSIENQLSFIKKQMIEGIN